MAQVLLKTTQPNPTTGQAGGDIINDNFTELYNVTDANTPAIALNTTHRGLTTGNPHSVTATEIGASAIEAIVSHDNLLDFASNEHFTVSSIDHGSIAGLSDDDHTQYLLADGSRDNTGDQLFGAHLVIGNGSVTAADIASQVVTVKDEMTVSSLISSGLNLKFNLVGSAGFVPPIAIGLAFVAVNEAVGSFSNPSVLGVQGTANHASTDTCDSLIGTSLFIQTSSGSGNATSGIGVQAESAWSGGYCVDARGFYSKNMGGSGGTDAYGLYIDKQTGSANNYGIYLDGNDIGADLALGTTKQIRQHFNGTNLEFQGSGIAHTAQADTPTTGYVTIAINGTPRKFAIIDP